MLLPGGESQSGRERERRVKICARIRQLAGAAVALAAAFALALGAPTLARADDVAEADASVRVTAEISPDEREVTLTASGGSAARASALAFDVWSEQGGEAAAVRHGAVQCEDGTWTARIFIASATPYEPGLPYHCAIEGAVHRLYNPNTGQHLYTANPTEADDLSRTGWSYERVAWADPGEAEDAEAVYRLYNPFTGDHLYTSDANEYAELPSHGWQAEGVAFHSDPAEAQPVYRLYNPFEEIGAHHYTTDASECRELVAQGWTEEGTCWFGAGSNADGSWGLPAGNQPHGDPGAYHVEAVALADGDESAGEDASALGEATFSVATPSAEASIENLSEAQATFDVVVRDVQSTSGVARVEVAAWGADDQHDVVWCTANPQEDGTYRATVRAAEHDFARNYHAHVYMRCANGLHVNVAQDTCAFDFANLVYLSGGPKTYTLTIVNPGPASSVRMPTWSEASGQDDLVWYEATHEGDRWTATISTDNLLDSGRCITHVYVDGQVRTAFAFSVSPKEVLTLRQRAILKATREVPTLGYGYCAGWVSLVLEQAGLPCNRADNAKDMYYRLHLTDLDQLLPGMAIAVSTHSRSVAGSKWGHVGIYLGDGMVVDDYGYIRHSTLEWWLAYYGDRVPVRFGFLEY